MDRPLRVAAVSPFEVVRYGLAELLRNHADRVALAEVATHDGHLPSLDAVLYDLSARDADEGRDLAHLLHGQGPVIGIAHDIHADDHDSHSGVIHVVSVRATGTEIVDEIIEAVQSPTSCSSRGAPVSTDPPPGGLTERELEMIVGVAHGMSNQEIADASFLSVNTVKTFMKSAYKKIGVTSRSQAVAWAITHGIAGP